MEKYLWRLMTAIFILMVAAVLGVMVFLFEGLALMVGICFYSSFLCALTGIAKGLFVMIDYHRENKEKTDE